MSKENFYAQVEVNKQQIIAERLKAEKKVAEAKYQEEQNKIKKEIEIKRTFEARKKETIKNFNGTNIIEILEEIRDKKILIYSQRNVTITKKNLFGTSKYIESIKKEPMDISYNLDSVEAVFDYWSYIDDEGRSFNNDSGSKSIMITKKNKFLELKFRDDKSKKLNSDFEISSINPVDIINGIARVVALQKTL